MSASNIGHYQQYYQAVASGSGNESNNNTNPKSQQKLQRTVTEGLTVNVPNPHTHQPSSAQYVTWLTQQQMFLASQKQHFVKSNNPINYTNTNLDLVSLEKAFEEDPFGKAPPIPHRQMCNAKNEVQLNNDNKYYCMSNSNVTTILSTINTNNC